MNTNSDTPKGKVVHLTSVHPTPFDVRIFYKECTSISRAGYQVTLIACHSGDAIAHGVNIKGLPRHSGRISRVTRGVWAVAREAIRQDADLYHFHSPELIPVGLLMRIRGKAVIYDVHENVPFDIRFKYYIPRMLRRPMAWLVGLLEEWASSYFSAVVPATSPISKRFVSRNSKTVVVSNYPIVDDAFAPCGKPWSQRSTSVGYAGVLSEDRCIRSMVQAMALLPADLPAVLKLAGAFSPHDIRKEVSQLSGWQRVEELGVIEHSSVATLLGDVRVGLVLYRPDPNYYVAVPNKIFEYMRAGIPVIAPDFPIFREIVETLRCGMVVNPLDPREIAEAVTYMLRHEEEAEAMGRRGREAVETRYNWATEEQKLLALYESLMQGRNSQCVA